MTLGIQNSPTSLSELNSNCVEYQLANDRQLLYQIKSTDPIEIQCAWSILYYRHRLKIWRYIKARIFNEEDAQDIFQKVWCVAIEKLQDFIWQGTPIIVWLQQVAKNQIATHITKSQRDKKISVAMIAQLQAGEEPRHTKDEDYRDVLIEAIAHLKNPMSRKIILLRYLQELSINESAERLDKKPNTIAQAHKRALQHIRSVLSTMMEE